MNLGAPEIIIIAVVIFALFGYRKLPDAARSVGRSMRIFKAETKGMKDDDVKTRAEAEVVRGPLETGQTAPQSPTVTPTPTPTASPQPTPSSTPTSESR
jgi:sec-independent protein translocase protein TatA